MTMTACSHVETKSIATRPFSGSVARRPYTDENSAAHGNVCHVVECSSCGARRLENVNGHHVEVSTWGSSLATRRAEYDGAWLAARGAVRAIAPIVVDANSIEVRLAVDEDGMIVTNADVPLSLLAFELAPAAWREAVTAARQAVVAAERIPDPVSPASF